MEWMMIMEIIDKVIAAIQECMENRSPDEIRAGLLKPGILEVVVFRRVLRKQGLRGAELRGAMREGFTQLQALGAEGVDALLEEAANP